MKASDSLRVLLLCSLLLRACPAFADPTPVDKSPSRDKVQWLGTATSLESLAQFDYVAGSRTDLGNGQHTNIPESQITLRQVITHRALRAFIFRGGVEWDRYAFDAPDNSLLPPHLHILNLYLVTDFRFSRKDLIRLETRPGLYSDLDSINMADFNSPFTIAYSHVVSKKFQWAAGVNQNAWRHHRWLGGGGFRWQINDRWKLKALLPEPMLEYKARDDLHVSIGADFRGDSFRVARDFGSRRNDPTLNKALLDFQEIRVGPAASWNILPLVEANLSAGYVVDRTFDYHDGGPVLTSRPAPYVMLNFQALFEVGHAPTQEEPMLDPAPVPTQFQITTPERVVPKVFGK